MKSIIKPNAEGTLPATHDRGSECIDLLAISEQCDDDVVIRSGYLPLYLGNPSDHRGYYCDLDATILFDKVISDVTHPNFRTFNTNNTKKCNKYVQEMEKGLGDNKILQKISKFRERNA